MKKKTTLTSTIESSFQRNSSLLVNCDNLEFLNACPDDKFAVVYLDPPFFTGKTRVQKDNTKTISYDDNWDGGLEEYLEWLRVRLVEIKRVLKPDGTIFLHLDSHASHYGKIELDRIFGTNNFINEIIWHYTGGGRSRVRFSNKHDTIFWYGKSDKHTFQIDAIREPYKPTSGYARSGIVGASGKKYLPNPKGTPMDDVWDIPIVNPMSHERNGYPTQKPETLLEPIIAVSTHPGDWVADFCCGSGTTCVVAEKMGRKWMACDNSKDAINTTQARLKLSFPKINFDLY